MTPRQKRRLATVAMILIGVGIATTLALKAFNSNLLYFLTPTEIAEGEFPDNRKFRVGGMVVDGSVKRDGIDVAFELTDSRSVVPVKYSGILPDLFREGQGIVANGRIDSDGRFVAEEVLAKHDENYMPPEVAEAMRLAKPDNTDGDSIKSSN